MATAPSYASKVTVGVALLTTGDASRTAPSTIGTIFTPDATNALGGQVERIVVEPVATTVASCIRIFLNDGTTKHLYLELQLQVQTAAGSTAIIPQSLSAVDYPALFPIMVPPTWLLQATVNDTQTGVKVHGIGGSF